ncbi:MAG: DUF3016 domain-containing protein [Pseudomonadota bacterium]
MPKTLFALLPAVLLCTGLAQAGTAVVSFDNADQYTDVGPRRDAESVQKTLSGHLQALAERRLPAGQTLALTITDIDLAGEIPPASRRLHDVRVMGRQPDWPRISLRYSLQEGDRVLAQGSDVLSDMAYLMRSTQVHGSGSLPYEQRMLSDWFDRRFAQPARH